MRSVQIAVGALLAALTSFALASTAWAASLPPLQVVSPANNASLKNPVAVVIETPGDISQLTMGGGMAGMSDMGPGMHLHIVVDRTELMPTAHQLTKVGPNRYRFTLPPLSSGKHLIKVYWADNKTHEPKGDVRTLTCTITG